ncbi:MAG: mechanosensitive ion channel family protein [Lachnospiraceae bacterium]|nr:mechanosensitive ion channel family protein [Lachnospiraceae bacterium]
MIKHFLYAAETLSEGTAVSEDSVSGASVSFADIPQSVSVAAAESVAQISEDIDAFQAYLATIPSKFTVFAIKFFFALVIFILASFAIKFIRKVLKKTMEKANADLSIRHFADSLVKIILYAVLVIGLASYFGIETTSLIALLGSAGVTVALAIQGSLSNVTGGVLILLLKPFKLGDYIHEDNKGNEGTVKEIGLFYTKLHTLDGRTVVLPNGPLANTSLVNVNMAPMRQIIMTVGISYGADIDKAKAVIEKVINKEELILQNIPIKVYVESLGSSAVTIGLRAFVKNEDYFPAKWALTENIKKALDAEGVEIPFDQLDVHIKNE